MTNTQTTSSDTTSDSVPNQDLVGDSIDEQHSQFQKRGEWGDADEFEPRIGYKLIR